MSITLCRPFAASQRTWRRLLLCLVVFSVALSGAIPVSAASESAYAPNYGDYNGISSYFVAEESYIDAPLTSLVIYSRKQTIALYVGGADLCWANDLAGTQDKREGAIPGNPNISDFRLDDPYVAGLSTQTFGQARGASYCGNGAASPTHFPGAGYQYGSGGIAVTTREMRATATRTLEGHDDLWVFKFTARPIDVCAGSGDCFFNSFRIMAQGLNPDNTLDGGAGIWISQDESTDPQVGNQFGISPPSAVANPGMPVGYASYGTDFATSCKQAGNIASWILLYDDDNHPNDPPGFPGTAQDGPEAQFYAFRVKLIKAPRNNGPDNWAGAVNVPFTGREFLNPDNTLVQGGSRASGGRISFDTLNGPGDWTTVGTWISNRRIKLHFDAEPFYKYKFVMDHVYKGNNVQFRLPFESVYADKPCQVGVQPQTSIAPNPVEVGMTATATYRAYQDGGGNGYWGQFIYTREMWWDKGTPGVYESGTDGGLISDTGSRVFANPTADPYVDLGQLSLVAQSGFESVCSRLTLSKASDNTVTILPTNPAVACTPIAKKPQFQANGGDVRSGGVYPPGTASRCEIPQNYQNYAKIVGADYTSYPAGFGTKAQFGVFAVGRLYKFGSYGLTEREPKVFGPGAFASATWANGVRNSVSYDGRDGYFNSGASWEPVTRCLPDGYRAYKVTTGLSRQSVVGSGDDGNIYLEDGSQVMQINGNNHGLRICQKGNCPETAGAADRPTYTVPAGKRIVIDVRKLSGNTGSSVVILDNVQYPANVSGVEQIPQFVLLVEEGIKVSFAEGVTRFDGMIIAKSSVNTCAMIQSTAGYGSAPTLSNNTCNKQLTVNGAIVTSRVIKPNRTFGNDNINLAPSNAEVFTLTPELMISDYYNAQRKPVITTVKQTELPPRF